MAMASPNPEPEQNYEVSNCLLSAALAEPDSDVDQVLEETPRLPATPAQEIELLHAEKAALQCTLEELEKLLEEKLRAEQAWTEKQKELEAIIEEKSEVIRELHLKLQDHPAAAVAPREPGITPREEELLLLSEELEHERRQLKEDEETVMKQMREMEVHMSRDRAELARQRNDLQRLHGEIRDEIELASRHGALRDRLEPLQRRHQEMLLRKGTEPSRNAAEVPQDPPSSPEPPAREGSGLFQRLFG